MVSLFLGGRRALILLPLILVPSDMGNYVQAQDSTTERVACFGGGAFPPGPYKSRHARGPALISLKGGNRAYVTVDAKKDVEGDPCENFTNLYVSKAGGPFHQVFPSKDSAKHAWIDVFGQREDSLEGMGLVDWSPDGHLLLTEATTWTYESDSGITYTPLLYDTTTNSFLQPELNQALTKRLSDKSCGFDIRAKGFANQDNLVLKAEKRPGDDDEGNCRELPKLIRYEMKSGKLQELPGDYQIHRFGKFARWGSPRSGRLKVARHFSGGTD